MWQGGRGRTVTWHVTGTNLPPRPHGFCTYKITPLLLQWSWYTDRTLGVDWWIEYLLGTERYLLYHSWPVSSSVSFKISLKRWSIEITFFTQRGGGAGWAKKLFPLRHLCHLGEFPLSPARGEGELRWFFINLEFRWFCCRLLIFLASEERVPKQLKQRANLSKQNVDVTLMSRQHHVNVCKRWR